MVAREKPRRTVPTAAPTLISVKRNKTSRRKMFVVRSSETVSCSSMLVLRLSEEALADPVLQEFAGAQSSLRYDAL